MTQNTFILDHKPLEFNILQQVSLIINTISLYRKGSQTEHPVIEKCITDFLSMLHEYTKTQKTLFIEEKKGMLIVNNKSFSPDSGSLQKLFGYFIKFRFSSIEFFPNVKEQEILTLFSSIFMIIDRLNDPEAIKNEIRKLNLQSIRIIYGGYEKVTEKETVIAKRNLNDEAKHQIQRSKELLYFLNGDSEKIKTKEIKEIEKIIQKPEKIAEMILLAGRYGDINDILPFSEFPEDVVISFTWLFSNYLKKNVKTNKDLDQKILSFNSYMQKMNDSLHQLESKKEINHPIDYKKIEKAYEEAEKELTIEAILYALERLTGEYTLFSKKLITCLKNIPPDNIIHHAAVIRLKKIGLPGKELKTLIS